MSSIYIQEPPTTGKVVLKTTIGDIDIELWTKEAPKACRNFIKLCYDGYYHNTIFHRVIKGFIVQGGDPTGTGSGGESIYGQPFKDEFHSRLRFCRRGLVAMANADKNDNGSQFFFTLAETPELQNKHTIFGKITGETLYNILKFEELEVDQNDRPLYPPNILKTKVLNNPFIDIVPRVREISDASEKEKDKRKDKKKDKKGVKDFKLLSFGEEAEEEEVKTRELNKEFSGKSKSAHDVLNDPKLSSEPALDERKLSKKRKQDNDEDLSDDKEKTEEELFALREEKEKIIKKLKEIKKPKGNNSKNFKVHANDEQEEEYYLGKDHADERKRKAEAIKQEIKDFKRQVQKEKLKANEVIDRNKEKERKKQERSEVLKEREEETLKYKTKKQELRALGDKFLMEKIMSFKKNIQAAKQKSTEINEDLEEKNDNESLDESIYAHEIRCDDTNPVLAKDANLKDDSWYEIDDPRNPLNKRRRGEITKKDANDRVKDRHSRK